MFQSDSHLGHALCSFFKKAFYSQGNSVQSKTASSHLNETPSWNPSLSSLMLCSLGAGWEKCRSWTPADCGLHEAAYPSRSAPSVLLPRDNFPHCLSNATVGWSMTRPCIKSAWSRCLWSPLSAFKAAHQLLLLCPTFLFLFFSCQLRRSLICNIIFTVQ